MLFSTHRLRAGLLALSLIAPLPLLAASPAPAPLKIADSKPLFLNLDPQTSLAPGQDVVVRGASGASFIKLHLEYFKLPAGAVLEVRDASGKEVYRYSSAQLGPHTVDQKQGEDVKTSFGLMSVNGELVRLRLLLNGAQWDRSQHGVRIRRFMEGYSHDKIETMLRSQQLAGSSTLSVCGVDERKDAVCFQNSNPAEYERSRPVARLVLSGGLCTAWRVGDANHMMTNNHCIASQADAAASEVWFNYQYTTCGGTTLSPVTMVAAADMLKTDATLDYTLFTVKDATTIASFGNFGLDVRTPLKDEQIFIPQHGNGDPKQISINSDVNTGSLCRIDAPVQNGNGTNTDAGYRCDTQPGSSGSPVLAASSKKVLALHHLGGCPSTNNSGALVSLIWPQIASYFNNQIPQGSGGTTPPAATVLTPNVALGNLSGADASENFYVLDHVDMYVKFGSLPSTSSYDCQSVTVGNNEQCNIATPQVGKYYVLLKGHGAYSGASLVAQLSVPSSGHSYSNTTRYDIPDNKTAGISSPITVPLTGNAGTLTVNVEIIHPYIGDLVVSLIAPNGQSFTLQNRSGGSADNIVKTFTVNAGSINEKGDWKLKVVDAASADVGYIKSWKINFAN